MLPLRIHLNILGDVNIAEIWKGFKDKRWDDNRMSTFWKIWFDWWWCSHESIIFRYDYVRWVCNHLDTVKNKKTTFFCSESIAVKWWDVETKHNSLSHIKLLCIRNYAADGCLFYASFCIISTSGFRAARMQRAVPVFTIHSWKFVSLIALLQTAQNITSKLVSARALARFYYFHIRTRQSHHMDVVSAANTYWTLLL